MRPLVASLFFARANFEKLPWIISAFSLQQHISINYSSYCDVVHIRIVSRKGILTFSFINNTKHNPQTKTIDEKNDHRVPSNNINYHINQLSYYPSNQSDLTPCIF